MTDNEDLSFMDFILDNIFYIEKSESYAKLRDNGVKSVEFIRIKGNKLLFIEAKKTFANPNNSEPDNKEKYRGEIKEITEKFIHSLSLFTSIKIGVNNETFSDDFKLLNMIPIRFILVIKEHRKEWCGAIQEALIKYLPPFIKIIWEPVIIVMNEEIAIRKGLVASGITT